MTIPLREYTDVDLNFNAHPISGNLIFLRNEQAIKQSIKNLIFMSYYDRPFRPDMGCGAYYMLFEPNTIITQRRIKSEIERVLTKYEPRISIVEIRVVSTQDEQGYDITITFEIVNRLDPLTVDFFLKRVR